MVTVTLLSSFAGEAEMPIFMEIPRPITTWLTLSDSRHKNCIWGELMFSLSYLPTAERLTVVVVKVRNLRATEEKELQNIFVKVTQTKNEACKKAFPHNWLNEFQVTSCQTNVFLRCIKTTCI
jgi:hypothetical protein